MSRDKLLSLKFCENVSLSDVTLRQGGHFAIIVNGCNGMKLNRIKIDTRDDRDGINFINSSNVELANSRDRAPATTRSRSRATTRSAGPS